MSPSFLAFIDELERLSQTLHVLARLTKLEAQCLAHARVEGLRDILHQKEGALVDAARTREHARARAAQALGVALTPETKLALLVQDAESWLLHHAHDSSHERLATAWRHVHVALDAIKVAQRQSEVLATRSLEWVHACLEQIAAPPKTGQQGLYTKQGKARAQARSVLRREA